MEKFSRVDKKKEEVPIEENEVRVTAVGRLFNYVNYAASLYNEKGMKTLVLKGMGRAINKTVSLAEIIKRRVPGLHQETRIGSVEITDTWEPKEEGLNELEITRHVSVITIILSSEEPTDVNLPGYQPPLPEDEVKPLLDDNTEGPPRRGRGRGRRGRGRGRRESDLEGEHQEEEAEVERGDHRRGSFRGRGRGYGWRGRGRGRGGGRGRGRGRGPRSAPAAETQATDPPTEAVKETVQE